MESADLGSGDHSAAARWRHQAWFGRILLEREMRTRRRVVADVRFQDLSETGGAQHDDMIETLATNRADEPFGVRVLPGRARCGQHFLNAHGFDCRLDRLKRAIAIADEIAWRLVPRKGFPELLRGPRGRRMRSHGGVHDAPAVMSEDHQHEQQTIGRHDLVGVIGQKRAPRLRGRTSSPRPCTLRPSPD
jgi:hypothetical protein